MLGPKVLHVPVLIGPVYFAVGYLAWTIASIILRVTDYPRGHAVLTVPLIAAVALVAWNLSFDPLASTVRQAWIWRDGGSYFGVPVSNFLGWYLTGYIFFQLFALYLQRRGAKNVAYAAQSRAYWIQAVVMYGMVGGIVVLSALTVTTPDTVQDAAGMVWRIREIYAVCALVFTFTMGALTLLAVVQVLQGPPGRAEPAPSDH